MVHDHTENVTRESNFISTNQSFYDKLPRVNLFSNSEGLAKLCDLDHIKES